LKVFSEKKQDVKAFLNVTSFLAGSYILVVVLYITGGWGKMVMVAMSGDVAGILPPMSATKRPITHR
jgi:hypothetical protein